MRVDASTLNYYSAHATDVAQRYESVTSELVQHFATAFPANGRVLDIGFGSGRDMAALMQQGFDAYGVDATPAFVALAQQHHAELTGRVALGVLPHLAPPFGGQFDGVLCSAVLMHLDAAELLDTALAIKRCLAVNGRLLLSVSSRRSDTDSHDRDANGRLFKTYPAGYLQLMFERLGFTLINEWSNADAMARDGIEWTSLLFQLKTDGNTRPIDQIVGVLNNDAKTATYKFALFRALADIAIKSPSAVAWRADGQVGLPIRFVAEKWLEYYWPIFSANEFIAQLNGESREGSKSIKFRQSLTQLAAKYAQSGGYAGFKIERNKGLLSTERQAQFQRVMSDITHAIHTGPVKHSGGTLSTGTVFSYDTKTKQIVMPKSLWLELSHLGYWVGQAVILQWAEKTAKLAGNISIAHTIGLLLEQPDERSTADARCFFNALTVKECVWTGTSLHQKFDVDHLIPFDLWHNNDAWNLLPASTTANAQKSNKLPSSTLLRDRKDCIIGYWELLKDHDAQRFEREAETLLTLPTSNWQQPLFAEFCQAIEVTALQRGANRWPT